MIFSVFNVLLAICFSFLLLLILGLILRKIFPTIKSRILGNKRIGGSIILLLAFFAIFWLQITNSGFLLPKDIASLFIGFSIIFIFGLRDDLDGMNWQNQAIVQSILALVIIFAGDSIQHIRLPNGEVLYLASVLGAILTYFWVVIVINSLNWIDGVDGLAGTVSLVTFAALGFLSLSEKVNQPSTAALCFLMVFLLIFFLAFNLPPAKFYLGTVGVWTLGFLISVISLYSGGKVATTALVLSIPILDFLLVFLERIFRGKIPVKGKDKLHLHQRLLEIGWSHFQITAFLGFTTLSLGWAVLIFQTANKIYLFLPISFLFFCLGLILLKNRKSTNIK